MEVDLNEVKINVRSLLTSSKKPLSVLQLQRDYCEQEGCNLPYRSLGFSSVIELLKNMTDVVTVPPDPNESSMLSLVVGDKTKHLRMLVLKQKTNTEKKEGKSNMNNRIVHQNQNGNNNFFGRNSYNQRMPTKTNNYSNNKYQNTRSDYRTTNNSSISSNRFNQSYSSSSKSHSDMNRNGTNYKANSSYSYVTDNLRSDIERYIIKNQMLITINELNQIVQKHQDYSVTDIHDMDDLKDRVKGFLNINGENVSLKNSLHFKSYIYNGYSMTQMNGDNSLNNSNSFLHSTLKKNNNDSITLNENQGRIPESVRLNIERIFKVYYKGVNIENFKFIYTELYNTILNPIDFDFSSTKQMLEVLDQIIEARNNVWYTKNDFKLYEKENLENDNECLLNYIYLNNGIISTRIEQPILSFNQDKRKMLLVGTYNPSLFYLQLEPLELGRLMIQMQYIYETKSNNYLVEPNQILPGLFYATSYSSFSNPKQWYRVKVLKVNSTSVEVIHVDYGTVDNIPKTELRFLNYKLCSLPCQAIHCCLTGYNELDSIALEVTKAFLEIINIDKQVLVMVDDHFIFSKPYQILHVTLFQYKSNDSKTLENINNELTVWHLRK